MQPAKTPSTGTPSDPFIEIDAQLGRLLNRRLELLIERRQIGDEETAAEHLQFSQNRMLNQEGWDVEPQCLPVISRLSRRIAAETFHHVHSDQQVAFLGPIYSFSYLAAVTHFGLSNALVAVNSIAAVFDSVERKQTRWGVVPIENSTDGRIVDTLTMLSKSPLKICGEVTTPIRHCLLGRGNRQDIRFVFSKPQAISQCRHWLGAQLSDVELRETTSTALAAEQAAADPTVAAIASREAGDHHGLQVIAEGIEDNPNNTTRFAIVGHSDCLPTGTDKTSLVVQLHHTSGSLASAMKVFQTATINLTWIESFPIVGRPNEYLFFIEFDGHKDSPDVAVALQELKAFSQRIEILGSYAKARLHA
jgi:chorismate mutase/prephenate dehydratase